MKPDIQKLLDVWDNRMTRQQTDLPQMAFDEIIASIFTAGPSYYYVLDFFDMSISHMSSTVKEIHGLNPDTAVFKDILNRLHPDDMEHISQAENKVLHAMYNIVGRDKFMKYKLSYCFRFKTIDGTYRLFLHQAIILTVCEKGEIAKALNIHTDISHISNENNYKASLISLTGEMSYMDLDVANMDVPMEPVVALFSRREREIAGLISEGFTNPAISLQLNIALDTVKNHRRNIMKKAQVNNTAQLIKKCILEGLI